MNNIKKREIYYSLSRKSQDLLRFEQTLVEFNIKAFSKKKERERENIIAREALRRNYFSIYLAARPPAKFCQQTFEICLFPVLTHAFLSRGNPFLSTGTFLFHSLYRDDTPLDRFFEKEFYSSNSLFF